MILITGGTGMVGAHLLVECVKKKQALVATFRREESIGIVKKVFETLAPKHIKDFGLIQWKKASLNDINALEEAFKGVEYVYHCAAKVSFADYKYDSLKKSNIEGTANVVNTALKHKVKKLVYVSSIAAIGAEKKNNQINEESNWEANQNHTGYAYTKYGAELEIWRASQEGLPVVIINPGIILGGQLWNRSSATLFQNVANGLKFYTTGSAAVVALDDVINILIHLMESDIQNERFILVAENLTQKELLGKIAVSLNKKPPSIPIFKSVLYFLFFIEKILDALFIRKNFLSIPFIETLNSKQHYIGTKICSKINFKYKNIDDCIKEIAISYKL
tara:strand:+ start:31069 stop:32070 length:1002 start_codon:yes stop_codon:yes gene_type:complete